MAKRHRRGRPVHGILLLDKPSGGSSNHALQRAKRLFGASKAGHTGSLDPLATGMLPVCFGEATKLSAFLLDADKGYETTLKLGVTTNSADADGEILETRPVPESLDYQQFEAVCEGFTGPILQVPPMVSAIKIDGQRLYKLARQGKEVDRPPRPVTIHHLQVLAFSGDTARLAVHCSKGTYIRSLVSDIGEALGCGAHVTSLRRTFVAPFMQYPMVSLETLERMVTPVADEAEPAENAAAPATTDPALWPALDAMLLPPDEGLEHLPAVLLDAQTESAFFNGNAAHCHRTSCDDTVTSSLCRVYDSTGRLAGLGELVETDGSGEPDRVSPRRVLQWS